MEPKTKREAEREAQYQEQRARMLDKLVADAAGFENVEASRRRMADAARAEAARLRALLPTLPE